MNQFDTLAKTLRECQQTMNSLFNEFAGHAEIRVRLLDARTRVGNAAAMMEDIALDLNIQEERGTQNG
jgi:hypothetical protein